MIVGFPQFWTHDASTLNVPFLKGSFTELMVPPFQIYKPDSMTLKMETHREFPVVRTRGFHCWGPGSIPGQGTKIPQAATLPPSKTGGDTVVTLPWLACSPPFQPHLWYPWFWEAFLLLQERRSARYGIPHHGMLGFLPEDTPPPSLRPSSLQISPHSPQRSLCSLPQV